MENLKNIIEEANSLIKERKSSEAVFVLKEAIKFSIEEPYLYYLLGIARMKCGRFLLAKRALEKANQLLPNNAENLRSLGWVKVILGELEEGRKNLRESISLDLTNPFPYLDIAMSYFQYFELEQGSEWLNRAKALSPKTTFVLENYKITESIKNDISKYSETQLKKMREEKLKPEAQKESRLFIIERFIQERENKGFTKDEMEEIAEELKLNGLSPQITMAKDGGGPKDREAVEYIEWHKKIKDVERKISNEEEKEITKKLFSKETPLSELKTCILRLAHQGTESALKLLQEFDRSFPLKLKIWTEMAVEECEFFLKNQNLGKTKI